MAFTRAMVILKGGTGVPKDQFVNVFHFADVGVAYETASAAVATALTSMYTGLAAYFSEFVKPTAEIRTYDMTQGEPRVPSIFPLPLAIDTSATSLPNEVAICLSFRGTPPVTPRRRGRVFLGPLNGNVYSGGLPSDANPPRPSVGCMNDIRTAGANLLAADIGWSIWSPTDQQYVTVVGGWCDNEFDNMLSRGNKPSARSSFGA